MELTIKSRYLNTNYSVIARNSQEDNALIIAHESLVDIIDNLIPSTFEIHYDFDLVKSDKGHVVVTCTICDKYGRRVKDLGEATYDSLETKIAKSYPCLMAYYRAFDRAVIRYLAFPGKVFSNTEGVPASPQEQNETPDTPVKASEGAQNANQAAHGAAPDDIQQNERQTAAQSPRNGETVQQSNASREKPVTLNEIGAIKMVFGKYKGLTIAEAVANDASYFTYMQGKNLGPTQRVQITAGIDYIRMMETKQYGS